MGKVTFISCVCRCVHVHTVYFYVGFSLCLCVCVYSVYVGCVGVCVCECVVLTLTINNAERVHASIQFKLVGLWTQHALALVEIHRIVRQITRLANKRTYE